MTATRGFFCSTQPCGGYICFPSSFCLQHLLREPATSPDEVSQAAHKRWERDPDQHQREKTQMIASRNINTKWQRWHLKTLQKLPLCSLLYKSKFSLDGSQRGGKMEEWKPILAIPLARAGPGALIQLIWFNPPKRSARERITSNTGTRRI